MNHITSPDHSDQSIERQIQAKGLNAPRVTPAALQAVIVGSYFFTAQDGVTMHSDQAFVPDDHDTALGLLTICVLVLRNGFTVLGKSACASPENFDADIGRSIARKNAEEEIWPLLGYTLKEQLSQMKQPAQHPDDFS